MKAGTVEHHFLVKSVRELPEINAKLWEMEYEKNGAQLIWLERPDENKAFSIAFKTIPEDDTGVFHILEHSVLCGSDRYPVKEPFVELLKSSVQTFLNAMTYPDKTVYPVSSRNDQDFLNLIHVYMDAVLKPAIYHKPEIFRQEGWRYEAQEGGSTIYQGVVLNEMKGSMANPDRVLSAEMDKLLFPDTCYHFVSGGDPAHIPDLTYEQFIANHQKYYHPSNARIALVGMVDMPAVLSLLDKYLSGYERLDAVFDIPLQQPVAAVEKRVPYEIGPQEPLENKTIAAGGTLLCPFDDRRRIFAATVLSDYLAGDNEAPLKRAVLQGNLAQDFRVNVNDGIQQAYVTWEAWNTDESKLEQLKACVRDTASALVRDGLDQDRLEACFNRFAFHMRDKDGSGLPRSLLEALNMLDTWLYGGDPAQGLVCEDTLNGLAQDLKTGYFEALIQDMLLSDQHTARVILTPSKELGQERRAREAQRLEKESAAWTEETVRLLKAQAESLAAWQQTPDSEEALATIPVLKLSDLAKKPAPIPATRGECQGVPVIWHPMASKLIYANLYFEASFVPEEDLPLLSLLGSLLGKMPTRKHGSAALQTLVKKEIGKMNFGPNAMGENDPTQTRVLFQGGMVCMESNRDAARALLSEILTETEFTNRARSLPPL